MSGLHIIVLFGASSGNTTSFDASRFRVGGTSLYGLVMQYELARTPPSSGLQDLHALVPQDRRRVNKLFRTMKQFTLVNIVAA